jgi:hypothetical protein
MSVRRTVPKRASIIMSYTWSTIFEDANAEDKDDYSVNEVSVSESFTIRCPGNGALLSTATDTISEDNDIEADDDFDEISEVTFQPAEINVKKSSPRVRKSTIMNPTNPTLELHNHSKCSTHCASTYQSSRERRRRAVSSVVSPAIYLTNKKIVSTSEDTSIDESADELSKLRVRKKSKFNPQKHKTQLIEGTFKLVGSKNYEEFLAVIGTGPCSQDMVMRADMVMVIAQEPDKQWRIANETLIKAKSVRGYRTNNRKWTENKFKVSTFKVMSCTWDYA